MATDMSIVFGPSIDQHIITNESIVSMYSNTSSKVLFMDKYMTIVIPLRLR